MTLGSAHAPDGFDERARSLSDPASQPLVLEQATDLHCEGARVVANKDLVAIPGIDSFGSNRSRDNRLLHGHRFQDLESGASSDAQGDDDHGGTLDIRPDVVDEP